MPLEPEVDDIVFERIGIQAMRDREFLERFVGDYSLGPSRLTVAMMGNDTLELVLDGTTAFELLPLSGTTFCVRGLGGCCLEFVTDGDGAVAELIVHQTSGPTVAHRLPSP